MEMLVIITTKRVIVLLTVRGTRRAYCSFF